MTIASLVLGGLLTPYLATGGLVPAASVAAPLIALNPYATADVDTTQAAPQLNPYGTVVN